jgi:hypothetical protein
LDTVQTSVGICHKIGPFPPGRENGRERNACLYADYPSEFNPADQELLANARLIASAPDLLAALEDALPELSGAFRITALEAIKKARGEK